jgi:hypothetical protein
MILNFLLIAFGAALIFSFLLPKPQIEDARKGEFEDDGFPKATENSPIPYVIGKTTLESPNTLYVAGFYATKQTQKVKTGLFSSKRVTTGYKYYMSLDLGLCLGGGTGVTLHEIWIDGEKVWSGTRGGNNSALIDINKPDLFGGKDQGGGFIGKARFYSGRFDQGVNQHMADLEARGGISEYEEGDGGGSFFHRAFDRLTDLLSSGQLTGGSGSGLISAYKGVSHIVFERVYIGEQPQLRAMKFVVSRFTDDLDCNTPKLDSDRSVNVAEAIYSAMTDTWSGMGIDVELIDADNFKEASNIYASEGNGAAGAVYNEMTGSSFVQEMLRQTDSVMTINPETNKMTLVPLRGGYVVNELPIYNEQSIVSVENFSQTLWSELVSQVKIGFKSQSNNYQDSTAVDQDLAVAGITGKLKTSSLTMPFVKSPTLAQKIAGRELNQLSKPAAVATLIFNRAGFKLQPGDVFRWYWLEYGIQAMVMRVKRVQNGDDSSPTIRVEVVRDPYGDAYTTFVEPPASTSNIVIPQPVPVTDQVTLDLHRFMAKEAELELPVFGVELFSYLMMVPAWTSALNDSVYAMVGLEDAYEAQGFGNIGRLVDDLDEMDGFADGVIPTMTVTLLDLNDDMYPTAGSTGVRNGKNLITIGGEILAFESFVLTTGNTFILSNVRRALLSTNSVTAPAGSAMLFLNNYGFVSEDLYSGDDSPVNVRYITSYGTHTLEVSDAPAVSVPIQGAIFRPDAPDYIEIASSRIVPDQEDGSEITITWRARNADKSTLQLVNDAAETMPGMTFVLVAVELGTNAVLHTSASMSTSTYTFTLPTGYTGSIIEVRVWSYNADGLQSLTYDRNRFSIIRGPSLMLEGVDEEANAYDGLVLLDGTPQNNGISVISLEGDEG